MKSAIREMSSRAKFSIFGVPFVASILLAMFPPFYLAGSGVSTSVLGVPFSVAYWIFDALLAIGSVWLLWTFESIRGELDDEAPDLDLEGAHR